MIIASHQNSTSTPQFRSSHLFIAAVTAACFIVGSQYCCKSAEMKQESLKIAGLAIMGATTLGLLGAYTSIKLQKYNNNATKHASLNKKLILKSALVSAVLGAFILGIVSKESMQNNQTPSVPHPVIAGAFLAAIHFMLSYKICDEIYESYTKAVVLLPPPN